MKKHVRIFQIILDNKVIKVDDKTVRLYLIDTAGQEEYAPLRDSYMRKAHGFILVYDVTNQKTLAELDDYHNQILRIKDNNPFGCVIFGNKCDLDKGKNGVKTEEGKNVAKAYKAEFFEGSAKLKKNIDEAFEACARQILEKFTKKTPSIEEKKKSSGSFIFKSLNDHNDTEIKF